MQALIAVIVAFIVTAAVLWFFFAPRKAFRARVDNGVQEAVVEVKGGYSPAIIEAEAGLPLRLIFDRKEDGECSSHVVFSDFGVDLALPAFRTTTLTLHPNEPGEYGFACGMNMLHGTLRVVPGKHHAAMPKEHSESEESTNTAESHVHMQSLLDAVKMGLHRHNLPLMNLWRISRNLLLPKPKYHLKIMRFPEVISSRMDGRNLRSILLIRRFSI